MGPLGLAIFYPGTKLGAKTLIDAEIMGRNRNPRWWPFAILDFRKSDFWTLGPRGLPIIHHCSKFDAKILIDAEIMGQNRNPKVAAVRHLGFSKIRLLNTGTPLTADFPSLYQIWRKNVDPRRNYGPKSKSKMAAIRSEHPQSLFIGPHWPVKFYANPMYSFEDMTIWIFCRFGLKCLFTPPKFWFLGGLNP